MTGDELARAAGVPFDHLVQVILGELMTVRAAAEVLDSTPESVYLLARRQQWLTFSFPWGAGGRPLRLVRLSDVEAHRERMSARKRPGPKEAAA